MEARVPARLTPREGRKFGLTVGAAFLALAAVSRWRGHDVVPAALAALGAVLVLAGLALPGRLGRVHRGWMRLALAISRVTTPVIMGALYFLVITPTGLVLRLLGHRPLERSRGAATAWVPHDSSRAGPADMERQF